VLLLTTLPSNPGDPSSWNSFIAGLDLDATKFTLCTAVTAIHEETCRRTATAAETPSDIVLATCNTAKRGQLFCSNCKKSSHNQRMCWAPSGGRTSQGPPLSSAGSSETRRGTRKKGAGTNAAQEDQGEDSSLDNNVHVIRTSIVKTIGVYSRLTLSPSSPLPPPSVGNSAYSARTTSSPTILINLGASSHIYSDRSTLDAIKPSSTVIHGFGGGTAPVKGCGKVTLLAQLPKNGSISVSQFNTAGCYTLFGHSRAVCIRKNNNGQFMDHLVSISNVVFTGTLQSDRVYHLDTPPKLIQAYSANVPSLSRLLRAHAWLVRKGCIAEIKLSPADLQGEDPFCLMCSLGKMTRASFLLSTSGRAGRFLALVHGTLWGRASVAHVQHCSHYMLTLTDDHSRWLWTFTFRSKDQAAATIIQWCEATKHESGENLAFLRVDNGCEFLNEVLCTFCNKSGMQIQTTSTYRMVCPNDRTGLQMTACAQS
jgi:hypothetical protein